MLRYDSQVSLFSRDRIVVSTSRCGRDNPGSNPGHGKAPQGSSWLLADKTFCYISESIYVLSHRDLDCAKEDFP